MKSLVAQVIGVLGALVFGCSVPRTEPTTGSETHFLKSCDDDCGSGLSCLCGTCTKSCGTSSDCQKLDSAAVCISAPDSDAGATCELNQTTTRCDVTCSESSECNSLGTDFSCNRGYCRQDPLSRPSEPYPGYGLLCEQSVVTCITADGPPSLVGTYSGQATAVLSSNALWSVRDVNTFSATLADQSNGLLSGSITLPSFIINVEGARIHGQGSTFSVYDSSYVDQNGCSLETRSVLSGDLDVSTNPATVTGGLALRFTGNYSGSACTSVQIDSYPNTGANFTLTATQTP